MAAIDSDVSFGSVSASSVSTTGNAKINKTTLANTASSDVTLNLPAAAGTIALTGLAPGQYTISGVFAGYISNSSAKLVFSIPLPLSGRTVTSYSATSDITVRGIAGVLKPAASSSGNEVSADSFNALTLSNSNPTYGSVTLTATTSSAWYIVNSTTKHTNHAPVTVQGTFKLTIT